MDLRNTDEKSKLVIKEKIDVDEKLNSFAKLIEKKLEMYDNKVQNALKIHDEMLEGLRVELRKLVTENVGKEDEKGCRNTVDTVADSLKATDENVLDLFDDISKIKLYLAKHTKEIKEIKKLQNTNIKCCEEKVKEKNDEEKQIVKRISDLEQINHSELKLLQLCDSLRESSNKIRANNFVMGDIYEKANNIAISIDNLRHEINKKIYKN